ncbi:unnamed protein product [Effrenium voratum]|nr:unnamed protein product [Effrenium voratum]
MEDSKGSLLEVLPPEGVCPRLLLKERLEAQVRRELAKGLVVEEAECEEAQEANLRAAKPAEQQSEAETSRSAEQPCPTGHAEVPVAGNKSRRVVEDEPGEAAASAAHGGGIGELCDRTSPRFGSARLTASKRTETLSTTSTTASEAPQPRRRLRRQVEDEEEPESTSAKDSQETRDQLSDADELSAGEADEPLDAEEIDEAQIARRERQQRRWEEKELGPEFAMSILSKEEFLRFKAQTASKPPPPEPKEALWSRGDEDLSDVYVRLCPNKPRKAGFFGARLSGRPALLERR